MQSTRLTATVERVEDTESNVPITWLVAVRAGGTKVVDHHTGCGR